mgnify:CR=1 FL=1
MYYHVIVELGAKYHKNAWDQVEIKADLRIIILENLMKSYPPFRTGLL